jgi:hypothetical protein
LLRSRGSPEAVDRNDHVQSGIGYYSFEFYLVIH